ncbi:MAG: chorismate synthase [Myxococcales bacterium]|nr:chorismate synthase [Myxococcales bacterium]
MPGNSTGTYFRVTTFGESHGAALGVVIDGCPANLVLNLSAITDDLARRRPGQSSLVSPRKEADDFEIVSGLFEGRTLGSPLTFLFRNLDADARPYEAMKDLYRPSHADFTTEARYGHRDWRGGGRASARETVARVAAGAVARQLLHRAGVEIVAWVDRVGDIDAAYSGAVSREVVDANPVRCPDPLRAAEMEALIRQVRKEGDTVGGVIRGRAVGVPAGWGEPVFGKMEARLAEAMMSIPAAKGFTSGSGFEGARRRGSENNDAFYQDSTGTIRTRSNHSGGIQGGISNGMPVEIAVAFKPVATLFRPQETVTRTGAAAVIEPQGRHDPCVVPRAVPIVEAMMALVLADLRLGVSRSV